MTILIIILIIPIIMIVVWLDMAVASGRQCKMLLLFNILEALSNTAGFCIVFWVCVQSSGACSSRRSDDGQHNCTTSR